MPVRSIPVKGELAQRAQAIWIDPCQNVPRCHSRARPGCFRPRHDITCRCLAEAATVGDDLKLVRELSCLRPDALSAAVFSAGTRPSRAALHARVSAPHALGLALGAPAGGGFAGDQHAIAELHLGGPAACGLEL